MRVATFNLLHGMAVTREGVSGESSADGTPSTPPPALGAVVASIGADVLALQEVDVHQSRSGDVHQVSIAAEAMGAADWRFVPAISGTPGTDGGWVGIDPGDHADFHETARAHDGLGPMYGVGLVSRLPVIGWRSTSFDPAPLSLPLLVPGSGRGRVLRVPDEPRVAVAAIVRTPSGPVTVIATHLSFVPGYNVRQLRAIRRWSADLPRPLLLLGDLNLPGGLPARVTGWARLAACPTYPSYRPTVQFDHVLADGLSPVDAATARIGARALALPISDHCALVVDVPDSGLTSPR